jgi:hypothetical protein
MTAEGGTLLLIQHITVVSEILVTPSVFCGVFNQVNRNLESASIHVKKKMIFAIWRFTGGPVMWHSIHKITYLFQYILP